MLKGWCIYITYQTVLGTVQTIEVPSYYSLSQNYPNPFNPSTTIKYGIPESGSVMIKIYNILGMEVLTLVNERKDAGVHSASFNAAGLSSGVYFYKIQSGDFSDIKKMVLIK
jgi:hypothetical protein